MVSLLLRNLFFTLLQPGVIAGLIPYWILQTKAKGWWIQPRWHWWPEYLAVIVLIVGVLIVLDCVIHFAVFGRGTLSPADPTKELVINGLYRYSRNPMYVGVLLILFGQAVLNAYGPLWMYLLVIFAAFYLFVVYREEPRLRREFGEAYLRYCQRVRRWI